jgi:co-chaperonin GroES (HSP10)|tara:strand:+ start:1147 stop:1557 length:411 start_codon:yes stop_codon:yes gene_type:complete
MMSEFLAEQAIDLSKILNKAKEEKARQLPQPKGYKILVTLPPVEEEIGDTGLIKSAQSMYHEQLLTNVLFVVELGDMCYSDKERFPSGPWCKKGDFIMCRANTGTRFKIHGTEFRLINDDSVEAVVQDPRGIERVN